MRERRGQYECKYTSPHFSYDRFYRIEVQIFPELTVSRNNNIGEFFSLRKYRAISIDQWSKQYIKSEDNLEIARKAVTILNNFC